MPVGSKLQRRAAFLLGKHAEKISERHAHDGMWMDLIG